MVCADVLQPLEREADASTVKVRYLVSCREQVVCHLVQVGSLVRVNEAHHLFENLRLHVVDLHAVLMETDRERHES